MILIPKLKISIFKRNFLFKSKYCRNNVLIKIFFKYINAYFVLFIYFNNLDFLLFLLSFNKSIKGVIIFK